MDKQYEFKVRGTDRILFYVGAIMSEEPDCFIILDKKDGVITLFKHSVISMREMSND